MGDIKPDAFAIGIHSLMGSTKNMLMNGMVSPPPLMPPAFPKMVMKKQESNPQTSMKVIGQGNE
jgi:hypothetical protein